MMAERNRRSRLEDRFELSEDYLHQPVVAELRPGLIASVERDTGEDRLLKIWWKAGEDADGDFRELWNHERLQLERATNHPDADEVLVGIVEMVETTDAFCVVYEPGALPLASRQRHLPGRHWLNGLDAATNRITLWDNLARLGKALGIVHSQGLVHGRLDRYAVYTEGSAIPDFKLGGFEWSIGIGEVQPLDLRASQIRSRIDRLIYSYADDWKSLGSLFAELLGLDPMRLREDDPFRHDAQAFEIGDAEIDLLRTLVDPSREDALDTRSITRTVEAITRELRRHGTARSAQFILLMRINTKMAEAIDDATDGQAPADGPDAQTAFVEADLASGARLVVSDREDPSALDSLTIVTEALSYRIRPFSDDGPSTWQIAVVVSIIPRTEARLPSDREVYTLPHGIVLARNKGDALAALARLRREAIDWTVPIVPARASEEAPEARSLRHAVLLVQVVDAFVKALDILPVYVADRRPLRGRTVLQLIPREGSSRDAVAAAIGERGVADVMDRLFEKDDSGIDVDWRLSTSGALAGRQAGEARTRFVACVRRDDGGSAYEFETSDLLPDDRDLFLRRSGDAGTESLIRRKLRTTRVLRNQRDLTSFFLDPRRRLRTTNNVLVEDTAFARLDEPKQKALAAIWTTMPSHLVVGPPGVGKTRLTAEIIRRTLEAEPASRLLLSAQSHQALDHLLASVLKQIRVEGDEAIVVRSRGADDAASTDEDVRRTAHVYLNRVLESRLVGQAPAPLRTNLLELRGALEHVAEDGAQRAEHAAGKREAAGLRALEALVLESANLVFSTSSSSDIERLVEDGAQFDRVIIEEAAKATGPELVAPLSLSGRRLLIGDHNQLPPFDSDRLARILGDKTAVRNALEHADAVLASTFFESGLDELQRDLDDEDALERITGLSLRVLEPFKHLVTEDENRRATAGGRRRAVASELLCQHRMDPALAQLVSACFYRNRLDTGEERITEACRPLPFDFGDGFPQAPIVFVDMPFASRTGRAEPVESGRPRWHNVSERRVVAALLDRLRPKSPAANANNPQCRPPTTVAILSPYRAQIERMLPDIEAFRVRCGSTFKGFVHDGRIHGTIDSSQGSEADLVIVSLVRNNHRSGLSALGFLSDPRRMNVLLSRARLQLVLVGSLEFLRESVRLASPSEVRNMGFVQTFLDTLSTLATQTALRGGPAAETISAERIMGERL